MFTTLLFLWIIHLYKIEAQPIRKYVVEVS